MTIRSPEPLTLAFVMDPIQAVDIDADTTFVIMLEAQRRGHRVLYVDPAGIGVTDGRPTLVGRPVVLRRERGNHVEMGPEQHLVLDEQVDAAFQRVDPPVDADYIATTQMLGLCERTLVFNRPASILAHNEKLFALQFRDLMPETTVSRKASELLTFMEKLGGEMIVKPLDGKGGEGIFHLTHDDKNLSSLLEQSTGFGTRPVMAQRYLPAIRQGDKRILLLEGEPIGAVLRVPADAEVRANLHVGGRAAKAEITAADRVIVDRLAPVLRDEGLFFVGIDVIGDRLTEINVTSPTGMQEIDALDDTRLEERFLERVEERVLRR